MKRRTAGALIGILAVVCVGLVFSVVYPFTTSDPHASTTPGDRFTVSNADEYSTTGRIVVNGNLRLAFEGVVTADGAWYQKVVEDNLTSEEYHPSSNGTVHHRLTVAGRDRAGRIRERITKAEDRRLVRENRDGDHVIFVVKQNTTNISEPVSGTASIFINSLFVAGYETDETDSSAGIVYEPQSGWYDESETYRISGASGEVRADAETRAVRSANVSWKVTEPAGTYAEYVLVGLTSDDPTAHKITFKLNSTDTDLERPTWVGETDSE